MSKIRENLNLPAAKERTILACFTFGESVVTRPKRPATRILLKANSSKFCLGLAS